MRWNLSVWGSEKKPLRRKNIKITNRCWPHEQPLFHTDFFLGGKWMTVWMVHIWLTRVRLRTKPYYIHFYPMKIRVNGKKPSAQHHEKYFSFPKWHSRNEEGFEYDIFQKIQHIHWLTPLALNVELLFGNRIPEGNVFDSTSSIDSYESKINLLAFS